MRRRADNGRGGGSGAVFRTVRKELRDMLRDAWFVWALLLIAGLGAVAAWTGTTAAHARARTAALAQARDYDRWLTQPPRNPHSASHFGMSAYYVPSRLAPFDPGVVPYVGSSLFLEAHKQNEPMLAEAPAGGSARRLGSLSLAVLLELWLPLVVIVSAARSFAAERERGTLGLLLSVGAAPWRLALGKALAAAALAGAVALPALIVVAAALPFGSGPWPADTAWRLVVLAAGAALYVTFWIALTVAVSIRASTWRLAMACLVAVWCAIALVVPRLAADTARAAHPLPNRATMDRLELESRMLPPGGLENIRQEILDEYGVTRLEDLPVDFSVIYAERGEARDNAWIDKRIADLDAVYRAERDDYLAVALATPTIAFDMLSMATAGTDDVHYRAFLGQAERYRRQMMTVLGRARIRKPGEPARRGDVDLWNEMPPFVPAVPGLDHLPVSLGTMLAVLALWCAAGCGAAFLALRRVKP